MSKVRVLVVDDAVVVRKIVTDSLSTHPDIEIAGVAANGNIALQKIPQVNPDIITLDVEMPELNGLETLLKIRESYPKLPVIMFSTLTERGAETTMEALQNGASDYCTKPANVGSVADARERVRTELLQKIFALCGRPQPVLQNTPQSATITTSLPSRSKPTIKPATSSETIRMIAIGVSTGGPNALADVVPELSTELNVPIVCVQHMPPVFTRMLAERLNSNSTLTVLEGQDGMPVEPNHMYIAPGDYHMIVKRSGAGYVLNLNQEQPENSCRPAVDPLFRSVAREFGSQVLGVVLTGMGQDGLRGCEDIKEQGGTVFVQDKPSSVVWGMPGYVAEAGLADRVYPLKDIAREINRRVLSSSTKLEQRV